MFTCKSEVLSNKRYKCKVNNDNKHNEIVDNSNDNVYKYYGYRSIKW